MKVSLAQHGGLAAGIRLNSPPQTVDSAALDQPMAAELRELVAAASSAPPGATPSGKTRDEMSYTITIEADGREAVLSQSDTAMSAEFGKLLAWLQRYPGK